MIKERIKLEKLIVEITTLTTNVRGMMQQSEELRSENNRLLHDNLTLNLTVSRKDDEIKTLRMLNKKLFNNG